jgi:hypothetical protein
MNLVTIGKVVPPCQRVRSTIGELLKLASDLDLDFSG